jgi:hypothetical protein
MAKKPRYIPRPGSLVEVSNRAVGSQHGCRKVYRHFFLSYAEWLQGGVPRGSRVTSLFRVSSGSLR